MRCFLILIPTLIWGQTLAPPEVPGAINPAVTQDNIKSTICFHGWTSTARPHASYTNRLKLEQMGTSQLVGSPKDYEEDHRVPLELGGHPTDARNLWPEPWARPYGAHEKDRLENSVKRDVCATRLSLAAGRAVFLGDWWVEYEQRYGKAKK